MSLTTRVETRVRAYLELPEQQLRLDLDWKGPRPSLGLEILPGNDSPTGPSGYWELAGGEDVLPAVRELMGALAEIERHLAPAVSPPVASAPQTSAPGSLTIGDGTNVTTGAVPLAPLAMLPDAVAALTNRWVLARAQVGGAVIPVEEVEPPLPLIT